jgi:hypothetical protein
MRESSVVGAPIAVSEAEGTASADESSEGAKTAAATTRRNAIGRWKSMAAGKFAHSRFAGYAIAAVVVILLIAGGIWWFVRPAQVELLPSAHPTESAPPEGPAELRTIQPEKTLAARDDHFFWEAKYREIDALRQRLLAKKQEMQQLKQSYHYGVLELEEEAAVLIKALGIDSLPQALKNRRLELIFQNIQRRQAYCDGLNSPLRWLDSGSEQLLYLKRRAIIDNQMSEIFDDIERTKNMSEIDAAIMKYELRSDRPLLDQHALSYAPLETIWRRASEQAKTAVISSQDPGNEEIIAEICAGNRERLNELTNLTLRASRCLAESETTDLFMNRLSRIAPVAVQKLKDWPGEWLCLNGLTQLPAESAKHLFRWSGQRLSLNGLSVLTADVAVYLAEWPGRQLELMGLQRTTAIEVLSQWEVNGGKLYVPDAIRKQIEDVRPR